MKMFNAALVFKVIVEYGSMSKAAEILNLNPSVVSKQLMFLERKLGLQLLKRTTRHLKLTETGEVFYERIANISQDWEASIDEITSLNSQPKGTIRISSPQFLFSRLIVPILREFQNQYPGIRLELSHTNCEQFPNLGADITICPGLEAFDSCNFVGIRLFKYHNFLFASPCYLDKHRKIENISDLKQHYIIAYGVGKLRYAWKFNNEPTVRINPYITSDSTEVIISSTVNGLGIAYIPKPIIMNELKQDVLVNILPNYESSPFEAYLYYQKMNFTPQKIRLLIDFLKCWF